MRRHAIRAAWSLLAAFAVTVAVLVALAVANGTVAFETIDDTVALLIAFAAFMVVGVLIVAHRPGNAVGWVFSAVALLAVTGATGEEWARYAAVTRPGSLPGAVWPPGGPPGPGTRPWPWWWWWCCRGLPRSRPSRGPRRRRGRR